MNINAIKKNFNKLGIELKVFFTIVLCADKNGAIKLEKNKISRYLKISVQTVGKYIRTFVECDIMKYKYSGEGMINPEFYYVGEESQRNVVIESYERFKSDITF